MVKPRKITLMGLLLMLLISQSVSAQTPLSQHFVSADGTLEFDYPADWMVTDALGSIILSNSTEAFNEAGDSVVPGTIFAVLFVQSLEGALPPQVEKNLWSAMEHSLQEAESGANAPDFGEVVELPIGGQPSYHSRGSNDTQDALILVLDLGDGYFGELSAVTAPGELGQFEATLLAILETVEFTPAAPPIVAGSVVWQQTGVIGEADGPDDYLVTVAVGPDDRIYTADFDTIFVFEPDGSGPRIIQHEALTGIRDLAVSASGEIWAISNISQQLFHLGADGVLLNQWSGEFGMFSPLQIEIGPDSNLYLLDSRDDTNGQPIAQIQVWSTGGQYQRTFPLEDALMYGDTRMAFGPDGLLYVLDMTTLQSFDTAGTRVGENIATARLFQPSNFGLAFTLDANGLIFVATAGGAILQQDTAGTYLRQFGILQTYPTDSPGDPAFVSGEFSRPQGVGILSNGDVVVADANFDYWQVVRITFPPS